MNLDQINTVLNQLAGSEAEQVKIAQVVHALDTRYILSQKIDKEPALEEILLQIFDRLLHAFPKISSVQEKRILDIACGSNTSKLPAGVFYNFPSTGQSRQMVDPKGYTALFEPWFCRILLEMGAHPVGVDLGDLENEEFEHYPVDLGKEGALDFLPDHSFDAVQDSRLFGSPEFTAQFPSQTDRRRIAMEIHRQEKRLLKPGGVVIHSDASQLVNQRL